MIKVGSVVKIYIYDQASQIFSDHEGIIEYFNESECKILFIPPGKAPGLNTKILISFGRNSGVQLYSCNVSAIEELKDKISLTCASPRLLETFQRRKFVRVDVNFGTQICVDLKPEDYTEGNQEIQVVEGRVGNLSAGGMLLQTKVPLPAGTLLGFSFDIPLLGNVDVLGEVVRIIDRDSHYELGIKFIELDADLEERLVHYVFAQELANREQAKVMKVAIMQLQADVDLTTQFTILRYGDLDLGLLAGKKGFGRVEQLDAQYMSVRSSLKLPIDVQLYFSFEIPGAGKMDVSGIVLGITVFDNGENLLSIKIDQNYEIEKAISKYLFAKYFVNSFGEQAI